MINFSIENFLIWAFFVYLIYCKFNINFRIRKALKISLSKEIKLLDCQPCFAFWATLLTTFNPIIALAVYLFTLTIEKK